MTIVCIEGIDDTGWTNKMTNKRDTKIEDRLVVDRGNNDVVIELENSNGRINIINYLMAMIND